MYGFGTLVNMAAIVCGGILGAVFGRYIKARWQEGLLKAIALCCLFIGINGAVEAVFCVEGQSLRSSGTLLCILSYAIGTFMGEVLDLEGWIVRFGNWIKTKTGNASDRGFVNAFVTASLTVCIGAMAVIGALDDALRANCTVLYAKSVMDFIIIMIMAGTLGKGALFAFIPVGLFQGSVTVFAYLIEPIMTPAALTSIAMTGSMMIFCIGVNLLKPSVFRVANMLPALVVAVFFSAWL